MGLSSVILTPGHTFKTKISQVFPAGSLTKIHQSWRAGNLLLEAVYSQGALRTVTFFTLSMSKSQLMKIKSNLILPEEMNSILLWEFNIKILKKCCNMTETYTFFLVLAGIDLIFWLVAGTVLCFLLVSNQTQYVDPCCTRNQIFPSGSFL